ncbi:hypothetical protein PROFUN_11766 [Planoprotostelium fungivorum]|uniref:BAR domain-containing protein n=1 Tax=Planoprotostelium fungivorum TaxID=1890364 RepID=A0A2P6N8L3_9EUKA|nr:hypothetical protein PROFUN_11766 [Planoprotostelium fungivorum]
MSSTNNNSLVGDTNQALCNDFKTSLSIVEKYYKRLFDSLAQHLQLMLDFKERTEKTTKIVRAISSYECDEYRDFLVRIADTMEASQQFSQDLYDRIELKLYEKIGGYAGILKKSREKIAAREKTVGKRDAKIKKINEEQRASKPPSEKNVRDLDHLDAEVNRTEDELFNEIEAFGMLKVRDMRIMCKELSHGLIIFHGRNLELMTKLFNYPDDVSEESEAERWRGRRDGTYVPPEFPPFSPGSLANSMSFSAPSSPQSLRLSQSLSSSPTVGQASPSKSTAEKNSFRTKLAQRLSGNGSLLCIAFLTVTGFGKNTSSQSEKSPPSLRPSKSSDAITRRSSRKLAEEHSDLEEVSDLSSSSDSDSDNESKSSRRSQKSQLFDSDPHGKRKQFKDQGRSASLNILKSSDNKQKGSSVLRNSSSSIPRTSVTKMASLSSVDNKAVTFNSNSGISRIDSSASRNSTAPRRFQSTTLKDLEEEQGQTSPSEASSSDSETTPISSRKNSIQQSSAGRSDHPPRTIGSPREGQPRHDQQQSDNLKEEETPSGPRSSKTEKEMEIEEFQVEDWDEFVNSLQNIYKLLCAQSMLYTDWVEITAH